MLLKVFLFCKWTQGHSDNGNTVGFVPVTTRWLSDAHMLLLDVTDDRIRGEGQIQQESTYFSQALQEERYRYERLEEQMNDLIELHQNEIENLKQGIADMEEKVQYQSEERLRDVHDILDNCQTRISRMEHQQHQHLQQLVTLDAVENSQARALLLKLVNIALTVLQVVLLLVATLSNIIMPFLRTRYSILFI
ncbi:Transmembrane and coiled-coil domains protein 1 [Araneus ventricosus]|uniref:Transmembrane and coiled-coil domains protein 1 n=1 Tax=Araneus ventricosus TaxID=182803 RepID=A0A4Y2QLP8_ARAVE|nr:Transmembrane and coiled-coil domains protein 1 [Araneus ventricosus]GBN64136.1 Transmembrane and coiled-coil domains protein 1 [Araneus ventricosus]